MPSLNNGLEKFSDTLNSDLVNHPRHYRGKKGIEVLDVIEDFDLNFNTGNATKYVLRAGKKFPDKKIEDLKKAVFYLEREISNLENSK